MNDIAYGVLAIAVAFIGMIVFSYFACKDEIDKWEDKP
jgi:hypothetical protein